MILHKNKYRENNCQWHSFERFQRIMNQRGWKFSVFFLCAFDFDFDLSTQQGILTTSMLNNTSKATKCCTIVPWSWSVSIFIKYVLCIMKRTVSEWNCLSCIYCKHKLYFNFDENHLCVRYAQLCPPDISDKDIIIIGEIQLRLQL